MSAVKLKKNLKDESKPESIATEDQIRDVLAANKLAGDGTIGSDTTPDLATLANNNPDCFIASQQFSIGMTSTNIQVDRRSLPEEYTSDLGLKSVMDQRKL